MNAACRLAACAAVIASTTIFAQAPAEQPRYGGTANETDHSARICTHIGLACQPDFMLSKPGLGTDEALMIQTNEMARTLAILKTRS